MKIMLGVLAAALAVALGVLGWMGALSPVTVAERDMGPYQFVYVQEASTDAARIGDLTDALGARLEAAGVTQRKPAQAFYPTGRGIPNQIGFLVEQAVNREVLGAETFLRPIDVQRYTVVEFPYRNPLSFALGHARVEGALREHRQRNKYGQPGTMVIHDGDRILYLEAIVPA